MTDRSQGGSSLNDGQLELMVHRRLLHTSHDSVEPLLFFDTIDKSTVAHRVAGTALMLRPEYLFIEDEGSPGDFMNKYYTNFTSIEQQLPPNVHLLTLQDLGDGTFLLRLEHLFEVGEGDYAKSVNVSLSDLFVYDVSVVKELALGGNTDYPVERLQWNTESDSTDEEVRERRPVVGPAFEVELQPMEIRTFLVKINFS